MAFSATFDLSSLNGSNGFTLNGINSFDNSGNSVSSAGDVNGDGIDDLIIGADAADPGGKTLAGQSYVVFGKSIFSASLDLSSLNGSNGFTLNGSNAGDLSGISVSSAGDVNGDGIDDLIIGAYGADPGGIDGVGQSYVVFGKSTFSASLDLSSLNGSDGFTLNGINTFDYSGGAVSSAGDVNGDGIDDLIIGAEFAGPGGIDNAGQSYVVFGKSTFSASFDLSSLNGSDGFTLNGINTGDYLGRAVSSAGDVNGDGIDDLIIGAGAADSNGNAEAGQSYIVFGKSTFSASLDLSSLNGTNGFTLNGSNAGDLSGSSVSSAGDVNGDGVDDLIIGAYLADPSGRNNAGQSYVVFGKSTGFSASLDLSSLNGTNGFTLNGSNTGDFSGRAVSSAGDVNGDGVDDLIIGAYLADPDGRNAAGQSYVVFGKSTGFSASLDLSSLNGTNGFTLNGSNPFDNSGVSVSSAGDVNGDGVDDLIIGAYRTDPSGHTEAGQSYVVFGVPSTPIVNLSVDSTAGTEANSTLITVTATASSAVSSNQTVSLDVSGTGITAGDYSLSSPTITILNGQTTGFVSFTVVNDAVDENTETATFTINNPSAGIILGSTITQAVTIADNDTAGVTITQSGVNTAITEGGITDSYTVALTSQPIADVTITLNPSTQTSASTNSLIFTAANWNVAQTITVTAIDDAIAEGTHLGTISHIASSSDAKYNGIAVTALLTIADNDTAGVTISQTGVNTAITEGGITDSYTVALTSQPIADVTITLNPGTQTTTSANALTFTAANWNVAQAVTVTAVDDVLAEGTHTGTITHTATSTDTKYNSIPVAAVTASIADNDNPPTDLTLSATSINENVAANTTIGNFTTTDLDGGSFTYALVSGTGSTHNSAFSISGEQLRIINSPDFETQPSYNIRVRTTDFSGLTYDKQISIIVNNLNDAPILTDTVVKLNTIRINAPTPIGTVGTSIFQLADFIGGSGQNNIIDPDGGALSGIAITNADTSNGNWFYSINNGTNWTALGGVSNTNARLLADNASTRLYFRPDANYTGTVANAITYRAWDQTSGTNGATADTTNTGNPTAFSMQIDTASLQVNRTETNDFTKDGITDILWRNRLDGQDVVWEMDGTTRTKSTFLTSVAIDSGWNAVATGDFIQDGKTDILWRNSLDGQNVVWEMDGTTRTKSTFLTTVDANSGWEVVGAGDFTKDGKTDILWRNSLDGKNVVWEMNGTTRTKSTFLTTVDVNSGWEVVGTGDFTKDGKTDILWRNSLDGQNIVWEMDGTTRTKSTFLPEVPASSGWKIAGVGDFTKDGNSDILWHNSLDGNVGIWGMNGTTRNNFISLATVSPSSGWNIV